MREHPAAYPISLRQAFRVDPASVVAFVGAGGKTTAMFVLARDLADETDKPVFVTTTTHLAVEQAGMADLHLLSMGDLSRISDSVASVILFTGASRPDGRLDAISAGELDGLHALAQAKGLPLLIEADGSRLLPLKAPAEHEPAIPGFATHVVVVAGLQGLSQPLDGEHVQRAERFAALSGLRPGEMVSPSALVRVLVHPEGGLKNIPSGARRKVLFNQADTKQLQAAAGGMAHDLLDTYDGVVVTHLGGQTPLQSEPAQIIATHERIAGIVLAAGGAVRFGRPKQLLPWRGAPLVWHAARAALQAGLDPVLVVAGDVINEIEAALMGLPVSVVHNPDWRAGQSTSLQAGLATVSGSSGGVVFLLADQPQIPVALIQSLVEAHAANLAPIVGPLVDGQRGNPVLFDCCTYPDLLSLSGDTGGRSLFSRWRVEWLPWHEASPLLDVDTPDDYARLQEIK